MSILPWSFSSFAKSSHSKLKFVLRFVYGPRGSGINSLQVNRLGFYLCFWLTVQENRGVQELRWKLLPMFVVFSLNLSLGIRTMGYSDSKFIITDVFLGFKDCNFSPNTKSFFHNRSG